jgi:choline-sulfatase
MATDATTGGECPNLLFVFTDQQRPDWDGPAGGPADTPHLADLVERGQRFADAVCPSPVCNPSRACLASGMEYDSCGVPGNGSDYPLDRPTLYRRLREEAGYHVMGCGKFDLASDFPHGLSGDRRAARYGFSAARFNPAKNNTVLRVANDPNGEPRDPYTAHLAEQGLLTAHVRDYRRRWGLDPDAPQSGETPLWTATFPTPLPREHYYDEWVTRNARDLLADAPTDRPWFLEVNLQNPHHPWDLPDDLYRACRGREVPDPVNPAADVSPETHREVRRVYTGMVEHLDDCLGRLLGAVEARGELGETLVVFASDHGEMLGDHGQWQKLSPHRASVGVPLAIAGPGVADRPTRTAPATILDLHATFLDYAGLDPGAGTDDASAGADTGIDMDMDSRSMRPWLAGEAGPPRDVVTSGVGSWRLASDGEHTLVRGYDPAKRRGGTYEPMAAEPEAAARRMRERPVRLWADDETSDLSAERPAVVERLDRHLPDPLAEAE